MKVPSLPREPSDHRRVTLPTAAGAGQEETHMFIRKALAATAVLAFAGSLAACESPADDTAEDQADAIEDTGEAQADALEEQAGETDNEAMEESLNEQADAVEEQADAEADAVEQAGGRQD